MKTKHNSLSRISFSSGLALAVAFAMWLPGAARAAEHKDDMGGMNAPHQDPDGSWSPDQGQWAGFGGRLYQTCLCIYMLEVYYRHLPIYKWRGK